MPQIGSFRHSFAAVDQGGRTYRPIAPVLALVAPGVAIGALLGAFVVLFANVPPGLNALFGLHLPAVAIFTRHWPYPVLALPARGFTALFAATVLALWLTYFLAAAAAKRLEAADGTQRTAAVVVAFAGLYNVLLTFFLPPVLSGDVFHYALFGRMVAWHGANPYLETANLLRHDPLWSLTLWRDMTTPYGPCWSLISAVLASLAGESVLLTLVVFKALAAASNLIGALLVLALARRFGSNSPAQAALYYAWNPLILIESAGSAHNDVVMVAIALFGMLLATRGRVLLGLVAILASALVKYLTFLLVMFYAAFCLTRSRTRQPLALAGRMALVGGAVIVVLYLPFMTDLGRLESLLPGFAPSFNPAPNPVLRMADEGTRMLLAEVFGEARAAGSARIVVRTAISLLFGSFLILGTLSMTRTSTSWARVLALYGWATLFYAYFVFGSGLPWYLVSPLAASAVAIQEPSNRWLLLTSSILGLAGFVLGYAPMMPA